MRTTLDEREREREIDRRTCGSAAQRRAEEDGKIDENASNQYEARNEEYK